MLIHFVQSLISRERTSIINPQRDDNNYMLKGSFNKPTQYTSIEENLKHNALCNYQCILYKYTLVFYTFDIFFTLIFDIFINYILVFRTHQNQEHCFTHLDLSSVILAGPAQRFSSTFSVAKPVLLPCEFFVFAICRSNRRFT